MICPYCGSRSRVIESRDAEEGVRRRRECLGCQARFTTYERAQQTGVFVIKKVNRREQFDRQKVQNGVRRACEKRPLPANAVDRLVDEIFPQAVTDEIKETVAKVAAGPWNGNPES